jgi:hypothetical protein
VAVAPGTNGNVLTSNGSAWASTAPAGGGLPTPSAIGQVPFSTDGSTYAATQKITQGTAVATTSGTSIDIASIPSWVKRITFMLNGVSTNGTSILQMQLGTSGGVVSSGYSAQGTGFGVGSMGSLSASSGFVLSNSGIASAANAVYGQIVFSNFGTNIWTAHGGYTFNTSNQGATCFGAVSLGAVLTTVRLTTVNGTDTFDAGTVNILYE